MVVNTYNIETILIWVWDGITSGVGWCVVGGLGTFFDIYIDGITHSFDEVMEISVSYIYIEGCSDGKLEVIVALIYDGINSCIGIFVDGVLGTGFYWD